MFLLTFQLSLFKIFHFKVLEIFVIFNLYASNYLNFAF
ncbi:hypothetical protein OUM_0036 [Helicobacter pylori R038b]|uniref:Uncharacterized protein n=1 Tax=Helicobacter pylori R038b TaxID=1145115 RepID=K2LDQ9_HELPX|nr:hypothetical protein OUM_0036 [Helicobacter pylori R038b]